MNVFQSSLERIPIANGVNAFQLVFWLLVAWACWAFWAYFGDKIRPWLRSLAPGATWQPLSSGAIPRGIDALHATLVGHGFTPEEADAFVAENFAKIRQANESKQ